MLKTAKPEGVVLVFLALGVLFGFTGVLASAYRTQRLQRAESHFRKGEELARADRPEAAVEEYRAALTYSHDDSRYQRALALSLMNLGRLEEAESHLLDLRENDPNDALTELMLARIAARQGRAAAAVAAYHQAIYGLWPDDPVKNRVQARFELIDLLARTGQPGQALSELEALADQAPDDAPTGDRIGRMLLQYGSQRRAAEIFQKVLARDPRDSEAADGAAESAFGQGNYATAANWYRRALRLNPANRSARDRLDETSEILSLDPLQVSLSANERFERARTLVEKGVESLQACAAGPAGGETQALISSAGEFLQARHRQREGDTPRAIALAEQIWNTRNRTCGRPPRSEEAVDLVMIKVAGK